MSDGTELVKKRIKFTEVSAEYEDLTVFKPRLPVGASWGYLGQVAWKNDGSIWDHEGLIVLAKDSSDALGEIVDWEPVFIDIEQQKFSTWKGIPADSDQYVSGGDFFVLGTEKPTQEQTVGIKAIRKDLVLERQPHRLIWKGSLPKAILSIWDVVDTDLLHVPTGAFSSTAASSPDDLTLPVVRLYA